MKAQILTLYSECTTEDICKNLAYAMEEFKGSSHIEVVNKESSIMYCAVLTDQKISNQEAKSRLEALVRQPIEIEIKPEFYHRTNQNWRQ